MVAAIFAPLLGNNDFQVGLHHLSHEFAKGDRRNPAQDPCRFGRVTQELIDFARPKMVMGSCLSAWTMKLETTRPSSACMRGP